MAWKSFKKTALVQGDGAQVFDLSGYEESLYHQIQIDVPTPDTGTMEISYRTPGAVNYVIAESALDLTAGNRAVQLSGFMDSVKITPTSLPADKHYNAILFLVETK